MKVYINGIIKKTNLDDTEISIYPTGGGIQEPNLLLLSLEAFNKLTF